MPTCSILFSFRCRPIAPATSTPGMKRTTFRSLWRMIAGSVSAGSKSSMALRAHTIGLALHYLADRSALDSPARAKGARDGLESEACNRSLVQGQPICCSIDWAGASRARDDVYSRRRCFEAGAAADVGSSDRGRYPSAGDRHRNASCPESGSIESSLAKRMGVSRPSIREALSQLAAEKIVTITPNRGPAVATISWKEADSIYEVRALLESDAAARCCVVSPRSRTSAECAAHCANSSGRWRRTTSRNWWHRPANFMSRYWVPATTR